jgi:hypothetical protein
MSLSRWFVLGLMVACDGRIDAKPPSMGIPNSGPGNPHDQGPQVPPGGNQPALRGRLVRRMSADQIRASLKALTGFSFTGKARVKDPNSPIGYSDIEQADLLDVVAPSLGRPDYDLTVKENLDPGASFSKFVEDAARDTCRRLAEAEVAQNMVLTPPRLLVVAKPSDTLATAEAAIRRNIAILIHRFWGVRVQPEHDEVTALVELFRAAASAPAWVEREVAKPAGNTIDGWRVVCVALATDPQFFVY